MYNLTSFHTASHHLGYKPRTPAPLTHSLPQWVTAKVRTLWAFFFLVYLSYVKQHCYLQQQRNKDRFEPPTSSTSPQHNSFHKSHTITWSAPLCYVYLYNLHQTALGHRIGVMCLCGWFPGQICSMSVFIYWRFETRVSSGSPVLSENEILCCCLFFICSTSMEVPTLENTSGWRLSSDLAPRNLD